MSTFPLGARPSVTWHESGKHAFGAPVEAGFRFTALAIWSACRHEGAGGMPRQPGSSAGLTNLSTYCAGTKHRTTTHAGDVARAFHIAVVANLKYLG